MTSGGLPRTACDTSASAFPVASRPCHLTKKLQWWHVWIRSMCREYLYGAQQSCTGHHLTTLHLLVMWCFSDNGFDPADGVDHRRALHGLTVRALHSIRLQGQVVQLIHAHSCSIHHHCDSIVHDHAIQPGNTNMQQLHPIHILNSLRAGQ